MALLKPQNIYNTLIGYARFHEWKFMALLKHDHLGDCFLVHVLVSMNENSWLYWSTGYTFLDLPLPLVFPWMKIHGSIEASGNLALMKYPIGGFHEWKFMALLKHVYTIIFSEMSAIQESTYIRKWFSICWVWIERRSRETLSIRTLNWIPLPTPESGITRSSGRRLNLL